MGTIRPGQKKAQNRNWDDPAIPVPITDILGGDNSTVTVVFENGQQVKLTRHNIEFVSGHVVLPVWYARKLKEKGIINGNQAK